MKKYPPAILVKTWLHLSRSSDQEFYYGHKVVTEHLIRVFGNVEVAELYLAYCKRTDVVDRRIA